MNEIERKAEDLLGVEYKAAHAANPKINFCTDEWEVAKRAVVAALATQQPQGVPEEVRRDADRYRWLRDVAHPDSGDGIAVGREAMNSWGNWFTEYLGGESMDVIIDAAMAAAPSPERQG